MRGDTSDRYWLPLEIGSGRGGLLEQMEQRLASYRADPERIMGELDFSKVDAKYRDDFQASFLPFIQKSMDDLNSNLLPFFRNHCSITELKRSAEALIPPHGEWPLPRGGWHPSGVHTRWLPIGSSACPRGNSDPDFP